MSRSKNELLLIALALFVMAALCLYSVFNPTSLKAEKVEGAEVYQETQVTTSDEPDTYNSDANVDKPETAGTVNINTASLSQLMTLEGIGEIRAQAIINYREEHGNFATTHEITEVNGIGEKTFEKIKDNICV